MTSIVFVGEQRSKSAKRMGVRWEDGRLAAKQLFDAFEACGYPKGMAIFINLFEAGADVGLRVARGAGLPIVAMGRRVQAALAKREIDFIPLVHPAARGSVRKKARYADEVRTALEAARA